ncbi:MAG: type II toxin-antitoxin system HicA family toxin [Pirellulales bacterium]
MKVVSGRHFCKVLERRGWELRRISGSHHIYAQPHDGRIVVVPVHGNRDLKRGLLGQLMKLTGIDESEL